MLRDLLLGTAAGAAGTVALNVSTYADMAIRGRASSSVPAKMAGVITDTLGISLASGDSDAAQQRAAHRRSGIGALLGYVTGLGVGTLYGVVRPRLDGVSIPLAGIALALAAMAGSDVPIAALGVSDPRTWSATDWASDLLPHLAYGVITAVAYEAFTQGGSH